MRHYADPLRHHAQIFLQRRFDLVGHPGDDPIPDSIAARTQEPTI
jgi:hypothetical protein